MKCTKFPAQVNLFYCIFSHKNGVTEPGHAVFRYFAAFFGAAGVSGRITFSFSTKPVLAGMYSSM